MSQIAEGQVVAAFGRHYSVELPDGLVLECVPRAKKSEVACGDYVEVLRSSDNQGVIEHILPRRSLLHRSVAHREKLIAANVTQVVVVVATEPSFSDELLARSLVAAHDQQLATLIVLNKCDLPLRNTSKQLQPYRDIGYRVLELCARENVQELRGILQGHNSVLVGQSGMGKSTLINALLPEARAVTRDISTVLDSGKHTTTHARMYHLDTQSSLIDCPGVQDFGLHHLTFGDIEEGFIELAAYRGLCHFHNCHHLHEPDCAIRLAAEQGRINARRLALFQSISQAGR